MRPAVSSCLRADGGRSPFPLAFVPACLVFLTLGCARYEFDVVEPRELAGHVGAKSWVVLRRDEVEYRLRSYDNRLVTHVYNRSEAPLKLLGPDSAAVDPRGESHPLHSATIPSGSYVKRIFPPPLPRVRQTGPTFGFGVGVGYGSAGPGGGAGRAIGNRGFGRHGFAPRRAVQAGYRPRHHHYHPYRSAFYDDYGPRYYTVYDPNDRTYFAWPGESSVRLILAYDRENGERFRHEFLFRRRKM